MTSLPLHGGDIAAAEARWGRPAQGWLDLSTGINPWPYPLPTIAPARWARLPDSASHAALLDAAARHWQVNGPARVVAGAGSQALIAALPRLFPARRVAILAPTYGEHARAWRAAGHDVTEISGLDDIGDSQVEVVVNPNNPDGRPHARETLLDIADRLDARQGLLVVDEAFADPTPALSLTGKIRPGLVVLRSFGKFFGLAGLRLGFAVAPPALAVRLEDQLGPWPVSGPALAVGCAALADEEWSAQTIRRLDQAARSLDRILLDAGLMVVGGTSLFRLASHPGADRCYDRLGRAGILVRAFAERPQWLRFGLPGSGEGEERLMAALRE